MLNKILNRIFPIITKQKTYTEEYLNWLCFANAGMLNPGNIYLMKYAIDHLPSDDPIIEIGSFCGLSTNVISYFLKKRINKIFCVDKYIFEGAENGGYLGNSDISHSDYKSFVKKNFLRNISFFSTSKPYPIELFSDEFFERWSENTQITDLFGRSVQLGGRVSFCYVDGNHTYEYVKRDFNNIDRHLVSGGFILFDDSDDTNPFGLTKLMREINRDPRYRLVMKNPNYLFQKY